MAAAEDIRRLALALTEAREADHHGSPSFRVADRIFCTLAAHAGRMMVKLDPEDQANLCQAHGEVMAPVPGYWGRKGSTYVAIDGIDEAFARMLLQLAWNRAAPARLRR